jgi:hypothetical protein
MVIASANNTSQLARGISGIRGPPNKRTCAPVDSPPIIPVLESNPAAPLARGVRHQVTRLPRAFRPEAERLPVARRARCDGSRVGDGEVEQALLSDEGEDSVRVGDGVLVQLHAAGAIGRRDGVEFDCGRAWEDANLGVAQRQGVAVDFFGVCTAWINESMVPVSFV